MSNLLSLVVTKKCGTRLHNSIFVGHGYQCLKNKAMELKDEIPFEDATVEGFLYQPAAGWQKLLCVSYQRATLHDRLNGELA